MAEAIIEAVINKLSSTVWSELKLVWGAKKDREKLQSLFSTITRVLIDAERRSISDESVRGWLSQLKDVAFDADDVLDEFHTELALRQIRSVQGHHDIKTKVYDFFSSHNPIIFRFMIAHKIKGVVERLDEITREREKFSLQEIPTPSERPIDRETHSVVNESKVYGREGDKMKVIDWLTKTDNDKDLSILPVVGLGGVGKTTFAQLVYNDEDVKKHFELQMWVCVTDVFDVKAITKAAAEKATGKECLFTDLDNIQNCLRPELTSKRFLLVLDDMWNESVPEWEKLRAVFEGGKSGSKIIVTTRSDEVARITGTVGIPYRLDVLSFEDCWTLFKELAFGTRREEEISKFVEIGHDIVNKCGGLPLAAKALGALMASRQEVAQWFAVKNSDIWKLPEGKNKILPALKISYNHLPSHLKQCFAYCSMFPKDHVFDRLKLIQLWTAEGFIQLSDENMLLENIGNQCFKELLWRSFFQDEEKNKYGDIVSCKMHDLMHDLACFVANGESTIIEVDRERNLSCGCRYISVIGDAIVSESSPSVAKDACEARRVRSFVHIVKWKGYVKKKTNLGVLSTLIHLRALDLARSNIEILPDQICKLKHLRLLDLSETDIKVLPNSITTLYNLQTLYLQRCQKLTELPESMGVLRNLRFLDLSEAGIKVLPNSITTLYNLQTLYLRHCYKLTELPECMSTLSNLRFLDLSGTYIKVLPNWFTGLTNLQTLKLVDCSSLKKLPEGMSNMSSLRHLGTEGCWGLTKMPCDMGRLSNLQTLSLFVASAEPGRTITELKHLDRLRGRLEVKGLENVKNREEAMEAKLKAKADLKELELCWNWGDDSAIESRNGVDEEGILTELQPHRNVRVLSIVGYAGSEFPSWLTSSSSVLPNLEELTLSRLHRCENLPQLSHLTSLRHLNLFSSGGIRIIGREFYGNTVDHEEDCHVFSTLTNLWLVGMDNLEEWFVPKSGGAFPSLQTLQIMYCPKLSVQPHLPSSIVDLTIWDSNEELLSSVAGGGGGCLQGLSRLTKLMIERMDASRSGWEGLQYLTALQDLVIGSCDKLTCLPEGIMLHHLPSLRTLKIGFNKELKSLGKGRRLQGEEEEELPPVSFTPLHHLDISYCPELTALPEWLGGLTSLQSLKIGSCPKLEMLPDGIRRLSGLHQLTIYNCPALQRRCQKERGEDWDKIAHIPDIHIREIPSPSPPETESVVAAEVDSSHCRCFGSSS